MPEKSDHCMMFEGEPVFRSHDPEEQEERGDRPGFKSNSASEGSMDQSVTLITNILSRHLCSFFGGKLLLGSSPCLSALLSEQKWLEDKRPVKTLLGPSDGASRSEVLGSSH